MPHDSRPGSASDAAAKRHGKVVLSLHARVLDIGLAGLAIETDTRLTPQRSLILRMGSPSDELELAGRVVWCFFHGTATADGGEQQPVYRAGIEFSDVLTPRASDLLRFLEAHAVVTMETRLFGRFRLDESGPVSIHSEAAFALVSVADDLVGIEANLGLEPSTGAQAAIRFDGDSDSFLATVSESSRDASSDKWRMKLRFEEPQSRLLERARALLASS